MDKNKFSPDVLIYGRIAFRGLVPSHAPIFLDEWLNVRRFFYIKLVKKLKRHIDQLYNRVDVIWQDEAVQCLNFLLMMTEILFPMKERHFIRT